MRLPAPCLVEGGWDGSTISSIGYTLDACGQVTAKDEYNVGQTSYTYDAEGQLTEVSYPAAGTDTFTYDNNGNRLEWTRIDAATTSYTYNAADQLTKSTEGTVGTSYSHDNNGNMTGQTTGNATKTFSYDAFDRMTSVTENDASLQTMSYGPDGKRLSLTDSSGTRKFFYDRDNVIQEYDSDWSAVTKEYTHGPWVDEPLSMTEHTTGQPNSTYYLMKDRLGSIINILDENEALKTTYSYDAFGQPTATYHSGQVDCTYRFAGREYDAGMGNYFNRARYYNQSLGRFFSRDPIMSLSSLYAYCNNSPANFTDPSGMAPTFTTGGVGVTLASQSPGTTGLILGRTWRYHGGQLSPDRPPFLPCGHTVEKQTLSNGDEEWTYKDDEGNPVRKEVHHKDENGNTTSVDVYNYEDGKWEFEGSYGVDELSQLRDQIEGGLEQIWEWATGTAGEVWETMKWAYDATGGPSGATDTSGYTYDEWGFGDRQKRDFTEGASGFSIEL